MSDCGCKGYYHNGGCSDQNVIFWLGADGKLPKAGIPVNPTAEELSAQQAIVRQRLKLPESARVVVPSQEALGSCDWPHRILPP